MGKIKIPKRDLYVGILNDDYSTNIKESTLRSDWVCSFFRDFGIPLENIFITDRSDYFIDFADSHRKAVLFADPGALGTHGQHGEEFLDDLRVAVAVWLENHQAERLLSCSLYGAVHLQ